MNKFLAIIKTSRPINFFITFFAVLISAQISAVIDWFNINILFGAFAMAFACSAGNVINDIFDIEIDKINKPNRILPKKILSLSFAKSLYILLLFLSLSCSYYNGTASLIFIVLVNSILFFYSFRLKGIILLGNITVALLTASALIYGGFIAGNIIGGIIPAVFAFLTNFIREIIKDMEDVKGDSSLNVITFPKLYGEKKATIVIFILTFMLIMLTIFPYLLEIYKLEYLIIVMVPVNLLFAYMLKLLYENKDLKSLKKSSMIVKLNMIFGLIAIYLGV